MDSLAGYQKSGKGPTVRKSMNVKNQLFNTSQVIFINHFYTLPMESYPHKINGPTKEIPPDERFLLVRSLLFGCLKQFYDHEVPSFKSSKSTKFTESKIFSPTT